MRIATANAYDTGIETLMQRQSDLTDAQNRLASGKRVSKASDDPAAAARAERAQAAMLNSDTSQRAVDASKNAMSLTDTALGNAGDLLQQARALLVSAGNATFTDADRLSVANQLKSIRDQLLDVANSTDGNGGYLFGGQGIVQKPFSDGPGGVQFDATPGQLSTDASTGLPLSTDGRAVWMSAPTGNGVFVTAPGPGVQNAQIDGGEVSDPSALTGANYTVQFTVSAGATTYAILKNGAPTGVTAAAYTSGQAITVDGMRFAISGTPANGDTFTLTPSSRSQTVFDALDQAISDLSTPGRTGTQVAQASQQALQRVDSVMGNLQSARSMVGAVLNRIDTETSRLSDQKLASQTEESAATDLDMVQAISDFQNQQSGYSAALQSYSMVQRLSLFQYLGNG
jgi:flagellar hook-associated protein 3 FlgL